MTLDTIPRPEADTASPSEPGDQPEAPMSASQRPARERLPRRVLHGVLLLDKPLGLTSNDALQRVRRLLRAEKAGHTGTLDPLATGLLPLCFGAATKFAQISLEADKRYLATLRLGRTTTTGDAEGDLLREHPVTVDRARIEAACRALTGAIHQVPPMHSALKHQGRALYEYAREGVEIERAEREVTIHAIDIVAWNAASRDELTLDVRCSKGTYIRTLAEDLGEALGCGAHLSALRRTASGAFTVAGAITLEALQAMSEAEREARLLAPDQLLEGWPTVRLDAGEAARFLTGLRRRVTEPDREHVRVFGPEPGALLGSGHVHAGELIADRLLSPAEVQAVSARTGSAGLAEPPRGAGDASVDLGADTTNNYRTAP
jgi:tRNA pseudouridine55 synthase